MLVRHLSLELRHVQRQHQYRRQRHGQVTLAAQTLRVDTGTWQVRREKLLENFANVGSLSSQATVTPYFVQGQQLGFAYRKSAPGEYYSKWAYKKAMSCRR